MSVSQFSRGSPAHELLFPNNLAAFLAGCPTHLCLPQPKCRYLPLRLHPRVILLLAQQSLLLRIIQPLLPDGHPLLVLLSLPDLLLLQPLLLLLGCLHALLEGSDGLRVQGLNQQGSYIMASLGWFGLMNPIGWVMEIVGVTQSWGCLIATVQLQLVWAE
jgi:hypothetical protein